MRLTPAAYADADDAPPAVRRRVVIRTTIRCAVAIRRYAYDDDYKYYDADAPASRVFAPETADGVAAERYEYEPYGERTVYISPGSNDPDCHAPAMLPTRVQVAAADQPYAICDVGFQGKQHDDATGLVHHDYREWHTRIGQWNQDDPTGTPDGENRRAGYHVMHGTTDPSGTNITVHRGKFVRLNDDVGAGQRRFVARLQGVLIVDTSKCREMQGSIEGRLSVYVKHKIRLLADVPGRNSAENNPKNWWLVTAGAEFQSDEYPSHTPVFPIFREANPRHRSGDAGKRGALYDYRKTLVAEVDCCLKGRVTGDYLIAHTMRTRTPNGTWDIEGGKNGDWIRYNTLDAIVSDDSRAHILGLIGSDKVDHAVQWSLDLTGKGDVENPRITIRAGGRASGGIIPDPAPGEDLEFDQFE